MDSSINFDMPLDCLIILISAGADFSIWQENGESILIRASYEGHTKLVETLLQAGADPDIPSQYGYTALYCACAENRIEIAELLLESWADTEKGVNQGYVPLCIASRRGNIAIIKLLIKAGANLAIVDEYFDTALTIAVNYSRMDVVRLLLDTDVKLADYRNDEGQTPLMIAIENFTITRVDTSMIRLFLEKCSVENLNLEDNYGVSALSKAHEYGLNEIVDLLIEAGAE